MSPGPDCYTKRGKNGTVQSEAPSMCITDRRSSTKIVGRGAARSNTLEAIARRWRITSWGIRHALASVRDPQLRADLQRLIDAVRTRKAAEPSLLPAERSEALAALCEALLRQFDDDDAGAAEIRLVVHKRDELPTDPASEPPSVLDAQGEELVWAIRQMLASSGDGIAEAAEALEKRGEDVGEKARELLRDEGRAIEVELAVLKTLLSDDVDWDGECKRLLADEVPPFETDIVDGEDDDEDG